MADTLAIAGQVGEAELSRIISVVLEDKGIRSVHDLVDWYERGRRKLLKDVDAAAKELGVMPSTLRTIISSNAFRAAYFRRVFVDNMDPDVLQQGLSILAADLVSPDTSPKDRLAIIRAIGEFMGVEAKQKVEHEITHRKMEVSFLVVATPDDFVNGEGDANVVGSLQPGVRADELGHALPETTGVVLEADFTEAEKVHDGGGVE